MFDLSAITLPTAGSTVAAGPSENAGGSAESGTATSPVTFDALLALQAAMQPADGEAAIAGMPEGGKILPDAANRLAALPAALPPRPGNARIAPARIAAPGADELPGQSAAEAGDTGADDAADASLAELGHVNALRPDDAMLAAIFASSQRLAPASAQAAPEAGDPAAGKATPSGTVSTPATASVALGTLPPAATIARNGNTDPAAMATALAGTARMELVAAGAATTPASPVPLPSAFAAVPTPMPAAPGASPEPAAASLAANGHPATGPATTGLTSGAGQKAALADRAGSAPTPAGADSALAVPDATVPLASAMADAPARPETAPNTVAARSETRAERIDFATLVDTLARAREEASPRTINVAVTNTDFGRVSLRFDSTDSGLAVAMSSPDPGFARAVTASSEAGATQSDGRGQNAQAQADARAQSGEAGAQRQPFQQPSARHDPRAAGTPGGTAATPREDEPATPGDSGIYA